MFPSFHTNPRGSWITAGTKVRLPPRLSQLKSHVCSQGLALTGRQTPDVPGTVAHATCAGGPAASPVRHLVLYNDFHPLFSAALGAGPPRFQLLSCAPSPDFWCQLMSRISVLTPPPRGGKPLLPDKQLGFTIFIISSWPQSLIPAVGEMPSQVPQMTEMNEIPPGSQQQRSWQTRTTAGSR